MAVLLLAICYNNRTSEKGDDTMKNIELSACEEMIMTIIWNNEAELDLAALRQTSAIILPGNHRQYLLFLQELRKKAFWLLIRKDVTLTINHL